MMYVMLYNCVQAVNQGDVESAGTSTPPATQAVGDETMEESKVSTVLCVHVWA